MSKLVIIYPFRDREVSRVKKSLDSLSVQEDMDFSVHFVDYGSEKQLANQVQELLQSYAFVTYTYYNTVCKPWNKALALNAVIKSLSDGFVFVSDVDMFYNPNFVKVLKSYCASNTAYYFKVGFLNQLQTEQFKTIADVNIERYSDHHATGMTLVSVQNAQSIRGFDEKFYLWGAEDTDFHNRLKNQGVAVTFVDQPIHMVHMWHESYRVSSKAYMTKAFQISNIEKLNQIHAQYNKKHKVTQANPQHWGFVKEDHHLDFSVLNNVRTLKFTNRVDEVSYLLNFVLSDLSMPLHITINYEPLQTKNRLKKLLGKKHISYFTMKEVNDLILKRLIHINECNYTFEKDLSTPKITLKIVADESGK